MWKVRACKVFVVGGGVPRPVVLLFFLPQNGLFCANVSRKPHGDIAHKPVCARVMCKGEGRRCQNKKRL